MKHIMLSLLFVLIAGVVPSVSSPADVVFGEEFTLKAGQRATLQSGIPGISIKLRFVGVPRDNRCPEGAQCIVPGNAKVELKFKSSSRESLSVILNTDDLPREVEVPGVRVELIRLTPVPKPDGEIDPDDYELTLVALRTVLLR
jgi:hypothetical protein